MNFPPEYVNSIAISPCFAEDGTCFAAQQNGLYQSTDGGKSWHAAYSNLAHPAPLATLAVAFSPNFRQDLTVFAAVPGSILRSTDRGRHWRAALLPGSSPSASALMASPQYPGDGQVLCATYTEGIFISNDRGTSWVGSNAGLVDPHVMSLVISPDFAHDLTLFAGTESGIFRSRNGGQNWLMIDYFPGQDEIASSLAISPAFAKDGMILAGTEEGNLFLSKDRGMRWAETGQFDMGVDQVLVRVNFAQQPELLVSTEDRLFYSINGGQQWVERTYERLGEIELTYLAAPYGISPANSLLAGTAEHGMVWI
jgi:photosystem II stability/assembly factor-like uncharacterized protein